MKGEKKKFSVAGLFYNDHFVMLFSIIAALILWFCMALTNTTQRPRIVYDVPIQVKLSETAQEAGLKVFSQSFKTASVSITGSSIIVNKVKPDDLQVVATLAPPAPKAAAVGLTSYTLSLTAQKKGNSLADYEVASVDPGSMTVEVDRYKEFTFKIENGIKASPENGYFANVPSFAADSVTVSGPESSVNKVSKVVAKYDVKDKLTETKVFSCKLIPYDRYGKVVHAPYLEMSSDKVDATIPVLRRQKVHLVPSIANGPQKFDMSRIKVDPDNIEIAGSEEALNNLKNITLNPIDFSHVNPTSKVLEVDVPLPTGFKNISNAWTAKAAINLSGYDSITILTTNFTVKNAPANKDVKVLTKNLNVNVVGPKNQLSKITPDNVYAIIDLTGQTNLSGNVEVPATIGFADSSSCWSYGVYHVNISATSK